MLKPVWTSVAVLLAFAAGFAAFALLSGLPAGLSVPVWTSGPAWSPSRAGNLVLSGSVAALTLVGVLLFYAIAAEVWEVLGRIADLVAQTLQLDLQSRLGVQALVGLLALASLASAWWRNGFAIAALVIAGLGFALVFSFGAALHEMGEMRERLTVRSRTSAIGGGQTEWQISRALGLMLLSAMLAGGMVTLAAIASRSDPPAAAKPADIKDASKEPKTVEQKHESGSPGATATAVTAPAGHEAEH